MKHLSNSKRNKIRGLRRQGRSAAFLAEYFKVSKPTVYRTIKGLRGIGTVSEKAKEVTDSAAKVNAAFIPKLYDPREKTEDKSLKTLIKTIIGLTIGDTIKLFIIDELVNQ